MSLNKQKKKHKNRYGKNTLLVCLSVYLLVSNKRQTDRARILYGTSHDPREVVWIVKIFLQQNSFVIIFLKPTSFFFYKIRELFFLVLQCIEREKVYN